MTTLRQAAEIALEALGKTMGVWGGTCAWHNDVEEAITTLKEALAQHQIKKCEAGPSLQDPWDCWDAVHGGQKPVAYMKQWPPGRWEQCSENYAGACPVYLHPAPIPGGWQLVNLNMTPEQRQLMLRADEFTVDEMWILLLAAAPKYEEQSK